MRDFAAFVCLALCCGCATAQTEAIPKPASILHPIVLSTEQTDTNPSVDDVLDALQASGNNLKTFSADLKRNEYNNGAELNRFGKIWFQIKPDGNPIMHLVLDRKQVGSGKIVSDKKEYLLDDGWLTDRAADIKVETRRQIAPPGQKVNLFQLGKGPFPLPIGQDKSEVHKQFDVIRVDPDKDDPAGTIHLLLKPKPNTPLAEKFSTIDVWVDTKLKMPVRIKTLDTTGNIENTNDLLNLKVNPVLKPEDLSLPLLPPDWQSSDQPLAR